MKRSHSKELQQGGAERSGRSSQSERHEAVHGDSLDSAHCPTGSTLPPETPTLPLETPLKALFLSPPHHILGLNAVRLAVHKLGLWGEAAGRGTALTGPAPQLSFVELQTPRLGGRHRV